MKAFTQLKIRDLVLKNRFVVSPMCSYSAEDGKANDFHLTRYGAFAMGGFGLIIFEATGVTPNGRISPNCLGLWNDSQMEELSKIVTSIKKWNEGVKVGIQLAHSGRKGSTSAPFKGYKLVSEKEGGFEVVAPSRLQFDDNHAIPKELTIKEIAEIQDHFVSAAKRAVKAGFDLIEIHGAHGYLINEFLSPLTNQRNDLYGGSFENRIRFLVEIVEKTRKAIPSGMPLFVRLSISEYAKNGWDLEDSVQLCNVLKTKGVDLIDCSGGGNTPEGKPQIGPCFQVPYAQAIRKRCGIMTGAVGGITKLEEVKDILDNEKADLILMARQALRNPYTPLLFADQLGIDPKQKIGMYVKQHGLMLYGLWMQEENEKKEKQLNGTK